MWIAKLSILYEKEDSKFYLIKKFINSPFLLTEIVLNLRIIFSKVFKHMQKS